MVTGTGELLDCNRGLVKNATGYDLRHLFVGSEGTLGFIVEADVRLAPAPDPQTVMLLGVTEFSRLIDVLSLLQNTLALSAFEFFSDLALQKVLSHRELRRPLSETAPFYALVEFDTVDLERATAAYLSLIHI